MKIPDDDTTKEPQQMIVSKEEECICEDELNLSCIVCQYILYIKIRQVTIFVEKEQKIKLMMMYLLSNCLVPLQK